MSKNDARAIYDSFYRGFQYGADVSLGVGTRPHQVPDGDPVFDAAAEMAAGQTEAILESKRAATGCGARVLAFVLVGSVLLRALT